MQADIVEITIQMKKIDSDQYFCKGQRLSFDLPWSIYGVKGDMYRPYFRVYVSECLMYINSSLNECYAYLQSLSREAAHIAEL